MSSQQAENLALLSKKIVAKIEVTMGNVLETCSTELIDRASGLQRNITLGQYLAPNGRSSFPRIILVPHRGLWTIPLHCLSVAGRPLVDLEVAGGDHAVVSYAHSAAILLECRSRSRRRSRELLVVLHPDFQIENWDWIPRENIRFDASPDEIVQMFNGGNQARPSSLDVHFATHGRFVESDPTDSFLALGEKHRLTLAPLLLELRTNLLDGAFLAACSSGRVEIDASADYLGIATGLLKGGARNVIGTFWPVRDEIFAELERAYYRYRGEKTAAQALSGAVQEVRRGRRLAMCEWAAFYCLGAGAVENPTGVLSVSIQPKASKQEASSTADEHRRKEIQMHVWLVLPCSKTGSLNHARGAHGRLFLVPTTDANDTG